MLRRTVAYAFVGILFLSSVPGCKNDAIVSPTETVYFDKHQDTGRKPGRRGPRGRQDSRRDLRTTGPGQPTPTP